VTSTAIGRIALALVIGFIVAVFIGLIAARRLARPLANAADAAHRLALGERDVRVKPEGPDEVAEIAVALNVLAEELAYSEGRQREFFLSISHELRTPLTAIRGYAEAMADGLVGTDDAVQIGNVVSAESLRLDRLVSDLLDLARTGAVDFPVNSQTVDLVELVIGAGEVWEGRCDKEGIDFSLDLPDSPVFVSTDPIRVRQIIDNLAENALRVTPVGAPIVFAVYASGSIEVRDGGPGLSDDDISVAFEPGELYERYKGVRKVGTGFGLALVGRLATRLGAVATAGKSVEGGAAFRIDFSARPKPIN
jgi:two-component system sensor histidine kinase BaeS